LVPERYGPAIKIIIDLADSGITFPSPRSSFFDAGATQCTPATTLQTLSRAFFRDLW
jgi:hypothetical protein